MIPELTIIVPTLNERDNISLLLNRIDTTLKGIDWEIIFVDDDSTDGTLDLLQQLTRSDERIRCIHRIGRRGLSSACLEGMCASSAPFIAVMDSDLQHDETLLPKMLEKLRSNSFDLAVGIRSTQDHTHSDLSSVRHQLSQVGNWLAHTILCVPISDPLSGFFMLTRNLFERTIYKVSGKGFKILLDIFASTEGNIRFVELPFVIHPRHAGESKLDTFVLWEYALLLFDKTVGRVIPLRFFMFMCVGIFGGILHLSILWLFLKPLSQTFMTGQIVATTTAISLNFILNNFFTYRDNRLSGWTMTRGLLFFYLTCSLGAFANSCVASYLFENQIQWWLAGLLGAIIGGVWNYAVSSVIVWPMKKFSAGNESHIPIQWQELPNNLKG